ncbi:MAG TPA: Hpt domain-containing protein, partial [Spongiibacteraceae bacterium]|nr:Hpt domain-containing protein [Spongiibacteraceae bacterium]
LRKYVASQAAAPGELREALERNDMVTAERIAHTAKAVNGNIGATNLQLKAEELEQLIHSESVRELIDAKLTEFESMLLPVLEKLAAALPPIADSSRSSYPAHAGSLLKNLAELLAHDDSEACDLFDDNAALIKSIFEQSSYLRLERAVRSFDFEAALAVIEQYELDTVANVGNGDLQ